MKESKLRFNSQCKTNNSIKQSAAGSLLRDAIN